MKETRNGWGQSDHGQFEPTKPLVLEIRQVIRLEEAAWWRGFFVGGCCVLTVVAIIYFFQT